MARRRKRTKTTPKPATNGTAQVKEKALPSLPPGAVPPTAFSPEAETPPVLDSQTSTPGVRSPPERKQSRREAPSNNLKRDVSPLSDDARRGGFTCAPWLKQLTFADTTLDGPTLPASTYKDTKLSNLSREPVDDEEDDELGFLPMAFDPNPAPLPPPIARKEVPRPQDPSPPAQADSRSRDYFGNTGGKPSGRDLLKEDSRPVSSRSVSTERERERNGVQAKASPHILSQAKAGSKKRDASGNNTPASGSAVVSPVVPQERNERPKVRTADSETLAVNPNEGFKLQEAPKTRRTGSRTSSQVDGRSPTINSLNSPKYSPASFSPMEREGSDRLLSHSPASQDSGVNPFDDPKHKQGTVIGAAPAAPKQPALPVRGDSLALAGRKPKHTSPEIQTPTTGSTPSQPLHERKASTSSVPSLFADAQSTLSRGNSRSKTIDSPSARTSFEAPPPRASSRTAPVNIVPTEEFTAPRAPPRAPSSTHRNNESIGTMHSNEMGQDVPLSPSLRSAGLPKQSMDKPFSMEDEMARILRGEMRRSNDASSTSVLRKVSNAVKHGRSFSDRGLHSAGKSSSTGHPEISSPMTISSPMSPQSKDSSDQLAAQLKRAQQRIVELESELNRLEDQVNSSAEIKAATNEIREKRGTMVVLDTQREMVVRELEVMTEHLSRAKDSNKPLDLNLLKSEVLKDFAESLQKLKDQMSAQIEDLMHRRNELTDEIGNLIQMKDKGFQEYEILSSKNAQLAEMNNKILQNIQDMYKSNRGLNGIAPPPNGLGIYQPNLKPEISGPSDVRQLSMTTTDSSMPNLLQENEAEPATILTAPQVVNIRKGQPKKFNWRKGGERVAKNVTKGIKGAFVSERKEGDPPYNIGMPYNNTQQAIGGSDQNSFNGARQGIDGRPGQAFGFFGQKGNAGLKAGGLGNMKNNSSTNLAADASGEPLKSRELPDSHADTFAVLFGSQLEARCEFERRVIPNIVSRCIDEVEARGMDMEGIYRKSGGSGQVKQIQQGFEKDNNFDISDEDLDIHAVTSALKQYFRKLPTPLITYEAYDGLLEAGRVQDKEKLPYALRAAVMELPEHHRDCLEYLILHLARVMAQESDNLMTPLNLAVVFAPTIMRPGSIEREMSDMQAQRIAVQAMLEHNRVVFPDE